MLTDFLQVAIGAIVWCLANVVYLDMKRKGVRGFTRFAAFWVGNPTTWITLFAVPEGKQPNFAGLDEQDLLQEIRADRALRSGEDAARSTSDGTEHALERADHAAGGSARTKDM